MTTVNEKRVQWAKENTKVIQIRLNNVNDADIIDFLDTKNKKASYIKELIRIDMNKKELVKNG